MFHYGAISSKSVRTDLGALCVCVCLFDGYDVRQLLNWAEDSKDLDTDTAQLKRLLRENPGVRVEQAVFSAIRRLARHRAFEVAREFLDGLMSPVG